MVSFQHLVMFESLTLQDQSGMFLGLLKQTEDLVFVLLFKISCQTIMWCIQHCSFNHMASPFTSTICMPLC